MNDSELRTLVSHWETLVGKVQKSTKPPTMVHEESDRTLALLRDLFNPSYESIHVNDIEVYKRIRDYVSIIAPESVDIIKLYRGENPIFDHFGITKQIKSSFGRIVSFKGGAYLVIEHTEALHVVDVNSGNRTRNNAGSQEENALEVNLGAADELARQLRLRDMGGIIVVDFIDMDKAEHRQALYERMTENMGRDRAKHNILPLSKFGLMQITRQRVRPATNLEVEESCPVCHGKGKIQPSVLFTEALESKPRPVPSFVLFRTRSTRSNFPKSLSIFSWRMPMPVSFTETERRRSAFASEEDGTSFTPVIFRETEP